MKNNSLVMIICILIFLTTMLIYTNSLAIESRDEIQAYAQRIAALEQREPETVTQKTEQYYNSYVVLSKPEQVEAVTYTDDDLYWLAKIVYAEAGYDVDLGQQAVANVVLNRVASPDFPDTIYDVIWQKTGDTWQFSPCGDGGIEKEPDERAYENARLVLEGLRVLPDNVLYFYMPTEANRGNWIRTRETVEVMGVHKFCR